MIIWGDADETMLQEKDHMSDRDDKLREAIRTIREHGVSYGPRDTTIKVALMEGTVHEILWAATRALAMREQPDSLLLSTDIQTSRATTQAQEAFAQDAVSISKARLDRLTDAAERSMAGPSLPHPDSLDSKALFAMWDAMDSNCITKCGAMRSAYKALYDHLTKPKTKTAADRLRDAVTTFRANGSREFHDLANMARALADFADEQLETKTCP